MGSILKINDVLKNTTYKERVGAVFSDTGIENIDDISNLEGKSFTNELGGNFRAVFKYINGDESNNLSIIGRTKEGFSFYRSYGNDMPLLTDYSHSDIAITFKMNGYRFENDDREDINQFIFARVNMDTNLENASNSSPYRVYIAFLSTDSAKIRYKNKDGAKDLTGVFEFDGKNSTITWEMVGATHKVFVDGVQVAEGYYEGILSGDAIGFDRFNNINKSTVIFKDFVVTKR